MRFKIFLETFYGVKDIQAELHKRLNPVYKTMGLDDRLTHVEVDQKQIYHPGGMSDHETGEQQIVQIYKPSFEGDNLNKIIQAVQYHLQDMGIQFDQPKENPNDRDLLNLTIKDYPSFEQDSLANIKNPVVKKGLMSGKMINVLDIGYEVEPKVYRLNKFIDDVDYVAVDPDTGDSAFIVSIGKDKATGEVYASTDGRFYKPNDPNFEYEAIWLR